MSHQLNLSSYQTLHLFSHLLYIFLFMANFPTVADFYQETI